MSQHPRFARAAGSPMRCPSLAGHRRMTTATTEDLWLKLDNFGRYLGNRHGAGGQCWPKIQPNWKLFG